MTRARAAARLAQEMLLGSDRPGAACASARVAAIEAWTPLLSSLEARDGIEAACSDDDDPRRAQVRRLRAIEAELTDLSRDDLESLRALQRETVQIVESLAPGLRWLSALRDFDVARPVEDDPPGPRDGDEGLRQLNALVWWAGRGAIGEAMPPVENGSPESRAVRGYVEALHRDPAAAIPLGEGLVHVLPAREHTSRRWPPDRDPARVAAACDPDVAPLEERPPPAPETPPESIFAPMVGRAVESPYACTAGYTARELGHLADRAAAAPPGETRRDPGAAPDDLQAAYLYGQGCDGGDAYSCAMSGWVLSEGPESVRDDVRARVRLRLGCDDAEDAREIRGATCARLGALLRTERGGERDLEGAWEALDLSCQIEEVDGCDGVAEMLVTGERAESPASRASLIESTCEYGSPVGCAALGRLRFEAAVSEDEVFGAFTALVRACTLYSDRPSCLAVLRIGLHWPRWRHALRSFGGRTCVRGDRALCGWSAWASDASDRLQWAQRGCGAEDADACAAVAHIEAPDRSQAALTARCEEGASLACFLLAQPLQRSNPARARALFRRSCEDDDGLAMGCAELAEMLSSRRGSARDPSGAQAARERACQAGRHEGTCDR